ncbi:MAG: hypothetical protein HKN20_02910 [Gemmatimonadetes bacterium]|nr:hypothetical protein [Gemmatimonadota bacterium]
MLFIGILTAYLLFAIAVGKLLAYAAHQDEVWTDIRENVIRPVPTAGSPARPASPHPVAGARTPEPESDRPEATRTVREKLPL